MAHLIKSNATRRAYSFAPILYRVHAVHPEAKTLALNKNISISSKKLVSMPK
jgi:hypothetical protein